MNKNNILLIIGLIIAATISRLVPHPTNFAPLGGMALFGGYYFSKKWQAFALAAGSWWVADLILNNVVYKQWFPNFTWISSSFIFVAISLFAIILLSKALIKKPTLLNVVCGSVLGSVIFFIVSNFGAFLELYPKNLAGLSAAYMAGIPFFKNTLAGDILYSLIIFGVYYFVIEQNNKKLLLQEIKK